MLVKYSDNYNFLGSYALHTSLTAVLTVIATNIVNVAVSKLFRFNAVPYSNASRSKSKTLFLGMLIITKHILIAIERNHMLVPVN